MSAATPVTFTSANPGWFGAVMASAVLASVLNEESSIVDASWLRSAAAVVLVIASLLSVLLLVPYLRRLLAAGTLVAEIGDPARGPMLATFPAGLLLLSASWGFVGPILVPESVALWVCGVLCLVGAVLAVAFSIAWTSSPLRGAQGLEGINGGWMIPPTALVMVALGLAPLISAAPDYAPGLMIVATMFLGAGLLMCLIWFALLIARLTLFPRLAPVLAPTMWIPMAPAAIVGLASMRLAGAAVNLGLADAAITEMAGVFAAAGLGFSIWWATFAAWDLRRLRTLGPIVFHPGWFAFLFPPSAVVLSFLIIQQSFEAVNLAWLSVVLVTALVAWWAYVLIRSLPLIPSALR